LSPELQHSPIRYAIVLLGGLAVIVYGDVCMDLREAHEIGVPDPI
jgi:hypothetical protein